MADSGDTTGVGLGFGGDLRSPFATTCEAVRAGDALGTGAPITTSSTTSGSAANTSHGGAGRKPAVARNAVNAAMCNRTDVIIATTSSNTDHGRVAATAWARGAFFGVGRVVISPRYGVVSAGGALSPPFHATAAGWPRGLHRTDHEPAGGLWHPDSHLLLIRNEPRSAWAEL